MPNDFYNPQNGCLWSQLQDFNIRYILNVTPNLPNAFETEAELGFKYMQIPIQDCLGENLAAYFDEAIEFIGELSSPFRLFPFLPLPSLPHLFFSFSTHRGSSAQQMGLPGALPRRHQPQRHRHRGLHHAEILRAPQ